MGVTILSNLASQKFIDSYIDDGKLDLKALILAGKYLFSMNQVLEIRIHLILTENFLSTCLFYNHKFA